MMHSMTGFSRKETKYNWGVIIWEIRSINQRYLEISIRISDEFRILEPKIRKYIQSKINRGKIECTLTLEYNNSNYNNIHIKKKLIKNIIKIIESLQIKKISTNINLIDLLNWPGVLNNKKKNLISITEKLLISLKLTMDELINSRKNEGIALKKLIKNRLFSMQTEITEIKKYIPNSLQLERKKLLLKFKQLKIEVDYHRFEQELLIIIQKMDIHEEVDRIDAHIKEIFLVLTKKEPIGRRLDFILQELNREANTLTSKSISSNITTSAIEIKVLIEQIREQVQNIE